MTFRNLDRDKRQAAISRRYTIASLFIFFAMLIFPALAYAPPVRALFAEWSFVAVEFALFFLTLATLFIAFANEPKRMDDEGNINIHWPP